MSANLIAKASTSISAPASRVWEALTNPELIKKYLFGTQAVSDWKEGSSLEFKGEWEGKKYLDKGIILKSEPEKLFQYTYLSSFSNLPDLPENYSNVTYELFEEDGETTLTVKQENVANEAARKHSEKNWEYVLKTLKDLLEK
ncbi:MAG TPA: SRPBCC family protein [Chryseolinea sp.]|nr:SRPBCC family protein [Chryseolinea sp.]